jgi:hypothetical protein
MRTSHFNQAELAFCWRISPRTLERWRWSKAGPTYLKIGGRVIYRLEGIEAFGIASIRPAVTEIEMLDRLFEESLAPARMGDGLPRATSSVTVP